MPDIGHPEKFEVDTDTNTLGTRWNKWVKQFEIYIVAAGITAAKQKKALLLHTAGPDVQDIFHTIENSDTAERVEDCIKLLNEYFIPKYNKWYERFNFVQRKQLPHENIDAYATNLKKLASSCKFSDKDERILEQTIQNCHSSKLRRRLLEDPELTLDKALTIARAMEASKIQADAMEKYNGVSDNANSNHSSNAVNLNRSNFNRKNSKRMSHSKFTAKYKNNVPSQNACLRCGAEHSGSCPAKNYKCDKCNRTGHFTKVCMSDHQCQKCNKKGHTEQICRYHANSRPYNNYSNEQNYNVTTNSDDSRSELDIPNRILYKINSVSSNKNRKYVTIDIQDRPVKMQIDSGSDLTVISEKTARDIKNFPWSYVKNSKSSIEDYNGNKIIPVGQVDVQVKYLSNFQKKLSITVVKKGADLLGNDWLHVIPINLNQLYRINQAQINDLVTNYSDLFSKEIGLVKGSVARLHLKNDAVPKFCPPRQIPVAIKPMVEDEINRLVNIGIWEKVQTSEWGTPLVPVIKKDGGVRLCGDYKITVNPNIIVAQHPLPNVNHMIAFFANCTIFTKIDLRHAFNQLVMDEVSQEICTLSTHMGLFRPKRLQYGVASSPALWQAEMDKIFSDVPGTVCFVDDLLVAGKDEIEHKERLKIVFEKIKEFGLKIKMEKCEFEKTEVEYLGFKINAMGIHKTNGKIKAIQEAKVPENVKELQAFLGLVTFYARFIPNLATVAAPLYERLKGNRRWHWTKQCQIAIDTIKAEITSSRFLVHYNPDLKLKLTTDASKHGVGAVLSHEMPDGSEKPIAYASKSLNDAQKNYAQIEKEAYAMIFGVTKFHYYLYGRHTFTLVTDHKPLQTILGARNALPTTVAARLQRWAITLAAYNYDIEYKQTNKIGHADALSRLPLPEKEVATNEINTLTWDINETPITLKDVLKYTNEDKNLSKLKELLIAGKKIPENSPLQIYKSTYDMMTLERGCILLQSKVLIPPALQRRMLAQLHEDHLGITKTKH